MAASSADIGYNSAFGIETATPGTYDDVAEVVSITPPGLTRNAVDATHLKSDNEYMEYIAGMMESGDCTIVANYVPAAGASDVLFTAFETGSDNVQITFPNGIKMQFACIFTSYEIGQITPEGKMEVTFTCKASGQPTLTA